MNYATLVIKNIFRSPLRSTLTVLAVALPMAMFTLTTSIRDIFDAAYENAARGLRLAVHHRITLINPIPERIRTQIEGLDPDRKIIRSICSMAFFGGQVENAPPFNFPAIAVDADSFADTFDEYGLSGEAREAWAKDRMACMVGIATAEHYGWKTGQQIELRAGVPPYMRMRFNVVKVTHTGPNPSVFWCRRDYVDESRKAAGGTPGLVNMIWLKCNNEKQMEEFARRIDASTANSPDETQTEDESTFIAGFMKALGDIPGKIALINYAVVGAIIMVVANTMSLAFRERSREMAALKAMGFPARTLSMLVMSESVVLSLIGGLAGVLPTYLYTHAYPITDLGFGPMKRFLVPESAVYAGVIAAVLVGVAAGAVPAMSAARLKVVDALRRIA